MLQADIIRPSRLSTIERSAWLRFIDARAEFASPLLTPEFAAAVGAVRDDAAVAVLRQDGYVVGVLPHHHRRDGAALPLGEGWAPQHALMTEPGFPLDLPTALRAARIGGFRFGGLVDPTDAARACGREAGFAYAVEVDDVHAHIQVRRERRPAEFDTLDAALEALGRARGEVALRPDDADPASLKLMLAWAARQARGTAARERLRPAWSRAFAADLFATRTGTLQGLMMTLEAGGSPVAMQFGVRRGTAFTPLIAVADPALAALEPGRVLTRSALRSLGALGIGRYELAALPVDEQRLWASERTPLVEGVAYARSTVGLPRLPRLPLSTPVIAPWAAATTARLARPRVSA